MVLLKALLGLLIGAVVGFIGGFILSLVLWIVVGIATWNSKTGENVASIAFFIVWLGSAAIGFALPLVRRRAKTARTSTKDCLGLPVRSSWPASLASSFA